MLASFTFEIDDKVLARIKRISESQDRSMGAQIRVILDEYFEKKK